MGETTILLNKLWSSLQMGGYGGYVWSAYLLTFACLLVNSWHVKKLLRRAMVELRMKHEAE